MSDSINFFLFFKTVILKLLDRIKYKIKVISFCKFDQILWDETKKKDQSICFVWWNT